MATKKKTGKIVITILIVAIVLYLIYVFMQGKGNKKMGQEGEWHNFMWGSSQGKGTEVLICCVKDVQSKLQIGDKVEIQVDGCSAYLDYVSKTSGHICETKPCLCRGDLTGTHKVVGFGDDEVDIHRNGEHSGFRIKSNWQGTSFTSVDIVSGKWRKVPNTNWW
tara:strand:- start:3109 stop:3600 length:492 start_codon:yes stop_codon:yes gene_type:complete